jgi:hypothetical protein
MMSKKNNAKRTKRQGSSRVPRALTTNTIYRFSRTANTLIGVNSFAGFTNTTGSTVYGLGLGIGFSLGTTYFYGSTGSNFTATLPNVSEMVALFDRFKIERVTVRIVPSFNVLGAQVTAVGTAIGAAIPICQEAVDFDDANAPTSTGDLLQRNDLKIFRFDKERVRTLRPRASMAVSLGAGSTGVAAQSTDNWIDTTAAGQDAIHYGLKYWTESMATTPGYQTGYLMVYVDYDLAFSVPR